MTNNLLLSVINRKDYYEELIQYRDYFAGNQREVLSKRQLELLNGLAYVTNVCELVVSTKADRINLRDMSVTIKENELLSKELSSLLWDWFKKSNYERVVNATVLNALRDGDAYIVVDYDSVSQNPTFFYHEQFDGTTGVDIFYVDMQPVAAIKKWRVVETQEVSVATLFRLNVYYPDRVIRAESVGGGRYTPAFDKNKSPDEAVLIEQFDIDEFAGEGVVEYYTPDKQPIGLPVIHFTNNAQGTVYGVSELANIISLQDTLNLSQASYLMATLLSGFNWILLTGSTQKQDAIRMQAGMIVNTNNKDVGVHQIQATNLTQLGEVVDRQLRLIATISKTPLAMLNPTGQLSAEGTLQQAETPLIKSIESKIKEFSSSFNFLAMMLFLFDKNFNQNSVLKQYTNESIQNWGYKAEFEPLTRADEATRVNNLVSKYRDLRVPLAQIWQELGYSEDEIELFNIEREKTRNQVLGELALKTLTSEQGEQEVELTTNTASSEPSA